MQVKNINATLENVGDYAWVRLRRDSETRNILAFRFAEEHWALYDEGTDDDRFFSGSPSPRGTSVIERYPFLSRYRESWIVPRDWSIKKGLLDLIHDNNDIVYSGIIEIDVPVDACASTIVCAVVEPTHDDTFISERYTKDHRYSGCHGYHSHHGSPMNQPIKPKGNYRFGIELEVEFHDDDLLDDFTNKTSNWFYCERDGSLSSYGCEIITVPLMPDDAKSVEFWSKLTDELVDNAKSWDSPRCGLHVHVSRGILGKTEREQTENLGKLLYLYHHYVKDTRMNIKIFGRDRGYHERDGKTSFGDAVKTIGSSILKDKEIREKLEQNMLDKSNEERYFDINIKNSKTIEFRKGKGSLNPNRITAVIEYTELMCKYAKDTPWKQICYSDFVSYIKISVKNEKLKEWITSFC